MNAQPFFLAPDVHGVDVLDLDLEHLLDRPLDLDLVGQVVDDGRRPTLMERRFQPSRK